MIVNSNGYSLNLGLMEIVMDCS